MVHRALAIIHVCAKANLNDQAADLTDKHNIEIQISGYRIERVIGRGGMATVYLAIQENFQRQVALKIMSPALTHESDFSERFLREARIVSQLVHPNIVTVHDVGIENGHHYLSMEYIQGQELKDCLAELSPQQLFKVVADVARALDYAGSKGYVHRDVKPENILLHQLDGRAILMDFGIARATDAATSMTRTGTAIGTPHYMSPEQARGLAVDGRSDLYSLGVLLYYLLLGKVPFDADSPVAIGIKHITESVPRLPQALSVYQPMVDKLLAKKPEKRYQTGGELLADLALIDVTALEQWQSRHPVDYDLSPQHTPLRNTSENLQENDSQEYQTVISTVGGQSPAPLTESDRHSPDEALHIPREDLDARSMEAVSSSGWMKAVAAVILIGALGFYFYPQIVPFIPQPLLSLLAGKTTPEQKVIDTEPLAVVEPVVEPVIESVVEPVIDQAIVDEVKVEKEQTTTVEMLPPSSDNIESDALLQLDPVAELLAKIELLSAEVDQQLEQTPELIMLYQQLLALQPDHEVASQGLLAIKQAQLQLIKNNIEASQLVEAQQQLQRLLIWLPSLEVDQSVQQLDQDIRQLQIIEKFLAEAEHFFQADQLLFPAGANAKKSYESVLAVDPDNEVALAGLKKIALRYGQLAAFSLKNAELNKALQRVDYGLSFDSENTDLKNLKNTINRAIKKQQEIKQLLQQAKQLEQQEKWFDKDDSAVGRYQQILVLEPNHQQAVTDLGQLMDEFYRRLEELIGTKEYGLAGEKIQQALYFFSDDDRLLSLLLEVESLKPVIENLQLSGQPIPATSSSTALSIDATIVVDRTLYIAFNYRNLEQQNTVLQVILFDGSRAMQIAAVPVVVAGKVGRAVFRIDRPVEGFTEGGYHIDIQLAGEDILSRAFVIDN